MTPEKQFNSFAEEVRLYPMDISKMKSLITEKGKAIKDKEDREIFISKCKEFLKEYAKNFINP